MVKKVLSMVLILNMIFATAYAQEATTNAENTTYTLSLDEAITIALTDNPQLKVCEINKSNYKTQLDAAKINKSKYKDIREISASTGIDLMYVKGGYYVETYKRAIDLTDYEYKKTEATITYNTIQKYYNLKNCYKLLEIAENSHSLVEKNYNNAVISYNQGLISKIDLENSEFGMKKTAYMVDLYKNNLEIAKSDFKIALRKNDENCEFVLDDSIICEDYNGYLAEDLLTAEKSRYDILSLKNNYELAKLYLDLTSLPSNTARYMSAYSSLITAEYNYKNNKDLILLAVKSSYNNITTAKNDLDIAQTNYNIKKSMHKITELKTEMGMVTNAELSASINELAQSEIELENAKLTYKLAVEKYKHEISIGL